MDIRHCIIPAAGLGTRFLPATKALPKELLPVLDRPVLQWGVEEAVAAGCSSLIVITSRGKEVLAAHFDRAPELEHELEARGKVKELEAVRHAEHLARFSWVYQSEARGLGHAVLQAEHLVQGQTVACMLPDDLSWGPRPVLAQLVEAHRETRTTILALQRTPREEIVRYGCAAIAQSRGRLHRITGLVEKPALDEAPSDLAVMGRYVLSPGVMTALRTTSPGAGGEIQLTDGIAAVLRDEEVWGLEFEGELLDVGTPQGWLRTLLRLAAEDEHLGPLMREAATGIEIA
jgi:UTP--glucose-1-phosphate uridylyltransferase